MIWLRTLAFLVTLPALLSLYLPAWVVWRTGAALPPAAAPWRWLGLVPAGLALAVFAPAVRSFVVAGRGTPAPIDPPRALVVEGLYRWVRNPMYVAVLCWLAGLALLFASAWLALEALAAFALFHAFVVGYEEPALARRFGAAYERYRAAVPRWLPRPPRSPSDVAPASAPDDRS